MERLKDEAVLLALAQKVVSSVRRRWRYGYASKFSSHMLHTTHLSGPLVLRHLLVHRIHLDVIYFEAGLGVLGGAE